MPTSNILVDIIKKTDEAQAGQTNVPKMPAESRHRIYNAILKDIKTDLSFTSSDKKDVVDAILASFSFKNGLLSTEKDIINQMASMSTVEQLNNIADSNTEIDDDFAKQVLNNTSLSTYKDTKGKPLNHKILLALANNINQNDKDALNQVNKIIDAIKVYDANQSLAILSALTDKLDTAGQNFITISTSIVKAANKVNNPINNEVGNIFDKVISDLSTKKDFTKNFSNVFSEYNGKLVSLYKQLNDTSLTTLAATATEIKTIDELLKVDDSKITSDSGFVNAVFENKQINKNLDKLEVGSLVKLAEKTEDPKQLQTIVDNLEKQKYFDNKLLNDTNANVLTKLAEHATNAEQLKKIASATKADEKVFSAILNKANDLATKDALAKRNPLAKFFGYNPKKTEQYTKEKRKEIFGSIVSSINARQGTTRINIDDFEKLTTQSLSAAKGGKGFDINKLDILYPETDKAPVLPTPLTTTAAPPPVASPPVASLPTPLPVPSKLTTTGTGPAKDLDTYFKTTVLSTFGLTATYTYADGKMSDSQSNIIMEADDTGSVSFPTNGNGLSDDQIKLFTVALKKACEDTTELNRTVININSISNADVGKILTMLKNDSEFMAIRNNVELTSDTIAIKTKIDTDLPSLSTAPGLEVVVPTSSTTTTTPPTPRGRPI